MNKRKIVVFGPGPQFKGGIANYTTSLAKAFDKLEDTEVHIVSWTQQYPSIIPRDFIDRSSKNDLLEGTGIKVTYVTNYNNPFSWQKTIRVIKNIDPDIVVFQWAIAVQGLPMGYVSKRLKKHRCEVIFDLHVVAQKEPSAIDKLFVNYGIKSADTYIVHAYRTYNELKLFFPKIEFTVNETGARELGLKSKHVIKLYHPIYDMFSPDPTFDIEKAKVELNLKKYVFLFFGFIRKYKGLHNIIQAFAKLAKERDDVSLLIVGESFWHTLASDKLSTKIKQFIFSTVKKLLMKKADDERNYHPLDLTETLEIQDKVTIVNRYVPNEEVHKYFQVADCNLLFYSDATPSGVESISYNFKLPSLATKVGHFPETIKDGYNGYLAEPENIDSMCETMKRFITNPIPRENVGKSAEHMSWENYAKAILNK